MENADLYSDDETSSLCQSMLVLAVGKEEVHKSFVVFRLELSEGYNLTFRKSQCL